MNSEFVTPLVQAIHPGQFPLHIPVQSDPQTDGQLQMHSHLILLARSQQIRVAKAICSLRKPAVIRFLFYSYTDDCIRRSVRLSALMVLYFHHLKEIFCPDHQDSLLYIQFLRAHSYSISSSIPSTSRGTYTYRFFYLFLSTPHPPFHSLSLSSPRRPLDLAPQPPGTRNGAPGGELLAQGRAAASSSSLAPLEHAPPRPGTRTGAPWRRTSRRSGGPTPRPRAPSGRASSAEGHGGVSRQRARRCRAAGHGGAAGGAGRATCSPLLPCSLLSLSTQTTSCRRRPPMAASSACHAAWPRPRRRPRGGAAEGPRPGAHGGG